MSVGKLSADVLGILKNICAQCRSARLRFIDFPGDLSGFLPLASELIAGFMHSLKPRRFLGVQDVHLAFGVT